MKKYILSLLLVATLVAAFIVPAMGGDVEDTFPGFATIYLTHSDGSNYNGMSGELNFSLDDGYFYFRTETSIESDVRLDGTEKLEVVGINGSNLDNIESFEYRGENETTWTNAFNFIVNTNHSFTQKLFIKRYYRIKFKGDVSFQMQYKVKPEHATGYDSNLRIVTVTKNEDICLVNTNPIKKEDITTTQATSTTTVAPSSSEVPSSSVEPSSSVVPTSTVEPTTVKPTTTVAPSTNPTTVAPTTVVPTVDPTTEAPTAEPVTGETASDVTTATPTKAPAVKAPGKAKIKKVWKKKRSAKKLKIKLAKVKNAKGYKVCVYKNKKKAKKHKKAIVTKYTTKLKYTIKSKKLKNKKKLFVGARAYNVTNDGTKVFGPWAKIKKVKVK